MTIIFMVFKAMIFPSLNTVKVSIILIFFLPSLSFGEKLNITLIPSSNSNAYTITADNIKSTIKEINDNSIQIRVITIEEAYSEKESLSKTTDLFLPIGQRALKEVLKYSGDTPILSSLISKYDFNNIIHRGGGSKKYPNIGAIYIDQPLERHLLFSRLTLPNTNRFGFIVSSGNKHVLDKFDSLINSDSDHIEIVNPGDNVINSLSHALGNSDVIVALYDPIIFNLRTTRSILLSTYRKRVPLIGFSKSYVKAGALAAIYSTPENIGKQTGEIIATISNKSALNNKSFPLPRLDSKYFSISVNNRVSRSLGLPTLDAVSIEKEILLLEASNNE